MSQIKSREYLNAGDAFVVDCSHQANVLVMDDGNMSAYRRGASARYYGGFYRKLPARISVPHAGHWNVILEAPNGARYDMHTIRF